MKNKKIEDVIDSLEKYRCSAHGVNYRSDCSECKRQFTLWAKDYNVNIIWVEREESVPHD